MNLIVDIGNTNTKVAVFDQHDLIEVETFPNPVDQAGFEDFISSFPEIKSSIVSAVAEWPRWFIPYLKQRFSVLVLDTDTPIPIVNRYKTPQTLGKDRLAGAVGAYATFQGKSALVVDMGTCIKYDIVSAEGHYLGGAISPGLDMRFKSMNTFTDGLPLLERKVLEDQIGDSTESSMRMGAQQGIVAEVKGRIEAYKERFENLQVIFTGGDFEFFAGALKNTNFADSFLVLKGLNVILLHNDEH